MMTLNDWIRANARRPLISLLFVAAACGAGYLSYFSYVRYEEQYERLERVRDGITLGVQQSNRPLIETAMMSILDGKIVVGVALCSDSGVMIAYPPDSGTYCGSDNHSFGRWAVSNSLTGMRNYKFVAIFSVLYLISPPAFVFAVALLLFVFVIHTLGYIHMRFQGDIITPLHQGMSGEEHLGVSELEELRKNNLERIRLVKEQASASATFQLAAQVAHDIRSPLAALGASVKGLSLPDEQRTLIDGAVGRMQGIADDLLRRYRAPGAETKPKVETRSLAGLIEQVVAEKRIQHKERPGLDINFRNHADGAKAAVDPKELQRIISNLVNNAVEALDKGGAVAVALSAPDGTVRIEVSDDGKGIPPEILSKLGQKGETHGKTGGTGLGLYHARTAVENWGGTLAIASGPGKGTAVTISLPAAAKPAAGLRAVLLDDDPLVHMNWKMAAKAAGAELKTYKTPGELAAATNTLPRDIPLYIDSELADGARGEDIAAELHDKGFSDITMATGHGPDKFKHLPWLKVAGKEPPWFK
jgi:signal transduction histidine kinase